MINVKDDPGKQDSTPDLPGSNLLGLSLISFLVYVVLAWSIFYFVQERALSEVLNHGLSFPVQVLIGLFSGASSAALIAFQAGRPPVSGVLDDFQIIRLISRIRISRFDRIQLSLFAGVGEELLFRGAIQPLLGIWLTSFIFVGLHGYFKFQKIGHLLFGGLMFGLSMVLGYLFEYAGLIAAMSAHAVYDVIMLFWVGYKK